MTDSVQLPDADPEELATLTEQLNQLRDRAADLLQDPAAFSTAFKLEAEKIAPTQAEFDQLAGQMQNMRDKASAALGNRGTLPAVFKVDTDMLDSVSSRFGGYATQLATLITRIEAAYSQIKAQLAQDNASASTPADRRIMAEMDQLLLPNLRYLSQGLTAWSEQVGQMSSNAKRLSTILERATSHIHTLDDAMQFMRDRRKNLLTTEAEPTDAPPPAESNGDDQEDTPNA